MFGQGLLKGLQITWNEMLARKVTVQYPEERIPLAPRFHGRFQLDADQCIACMLCANACPNKVIQITREKVGKKQFLTRYVMRIEYCLFCGLCVEACNQGALKFSNVIDMNQYFRKEVPLVLVDRPAPPPEAAEDQGEPASGPPARPKAATAARTAQPGVAAGRAPDKEGEA